MCQSGLLGAKIHKSILLGAKRCAKMPARKPNHLSLGSPSIKKCPLVEMCKKNRAKYMVHNVQDLYHMLMLGSKI